MIACPYLLGQWYESYVRTLVSLFARELLQTDRTSRRLQRSLKLGTCGCVGVDRNSMPGEPTVPDRIVPVSIRDLSEFRAVTVDVPISLKNALYQDRTMAFRLHGAACRSSQIEPPLMRGEKKSSRCLKDRVFTESPCNVARSSSAGSTTIARPFHVDTLSPKISRLILTRATLPRIIRARVQSYASPSSSRIVQYRRVGPI